MIASRPQDPTTEMRADGSARRASSSRLTPNEAENAAVRRAVMLTLTYSDVFNYPLRADEIWQNLVVPAPKEAVAAVLDELVPDALSRTEDGLYCLRDREQIGPLRQARAASAIAGWREAERFTRWLSHVPFVRMVAVCGSLAVENAGPDGDVDLFLITAPGRLWLVQSAAMVLRRLAWRPGRPPFCPNYLLSEHELRVGPRNLYIAHEITQARPLFGHALFARFRRENAWTLEFLPQNRPEDDPAQPAGLAFLRPADASDDSVDSQEPSRAQAPSRIQARLERLLGGRIGSWLDAAIHRTLLYYYRMRLRRHGWTLDEIGRAYRRDRQTVVTGGYLGAIEARFVDRAQSRLMATVGLSEAEAHDLVRQTFHGTARSDASAPSAGSSATDSGLSGSAASDDAPSGPPGGDPVYAGILGERYGDDVS